MKYLPYIVIAVLILFIVFRPARVEHVPGEVVRDTVTVIDTVRDTVPKPYRIEVMRMDTFYLPIFVGDSLEVDSVPVVLPIEKKEYKTVDKLSEECRYVCVPRIMKTEFGETLCPKICGMPDMAASDKLVFNEAVCINDRKQLHKYLKRQLKKMKIKRRGLAKAIDKAAKAQREYRYSDDEGYEYNVFIAAHEYNLNNTYSNMNLVDRLHRMGIGVIQGRDISRYEKITRIEKLHLIKRPYWDALTDILARAVILSEQKTVDAVICMSSFNCGIDSILTALIYKYITDIPVFNLKIDEHRADAGFETRLEAFGDIVREAAI